MARKTSIRISQLAPASSSTFSGITYSIKSSSLPAASIYPYKRYLLFSTSCACGSVIRRLQCFSVVRGCPRLPLLSAERHHSRPPMTRMPTCFVRRLFLRGRLARRWLKCYSSIPPLRAQPCSSTTCFLSGGTPSTVDKMPPHLLILGSRYGRDTPVITAAPKAASSRP